MAFWATTKPTYSLLSPREHSLFLSFLRACPFLTPLKRLTVPTFNTMTSQLAVSQFSPIPTSYYGSFFIWACPFALGAVATAHSTPQAPSGLERKGEKKTKLQSSSPMFSYCPFKNVVSRILQTNMIASITFAFSSSRVSHSLEGNISPYCFHIQKVVTPSKIAT